MRPLAILLAAVTIAYAQQPKKRPAIPPKPAAAKPAEPKPAGPPAFLIESISFDGLKLYQPDQLIEFTGLKLGEPGDKAKFDAAQQKLADSGAFASVGYRYEPSRGGKGYAVTFEIAEVEQIYPIRFDDLPMSGKELRAALKKFDPLFNGKVPGTQAVVQRYAKGIQQILKSEEAISGKLISEAPGELLIVFRPASAPLAIAEIEFTGNQAIPAATLRNTISGVAVGVAYSEPKMRLLLDSAVRPLYDQRGYVRLAFGKITAAPSQSKDVHGIAVKVELTEGEMYKLADVRVLGAPFAGELKKTANFKLDEVVDFTEIDEGIARMKKYLARNGYMRAAFKTERRIDDAKKVISLDLRGDPGPRFTFAKLNITGLDIHSEPVIRKMWSMKEGKVFNAEYPEFFLIRVREDGVFDNLGDTTHKLDIDEKGKTVTVNLFFKGSGPKPKKKKDEFGGERPPEE